jgi:hypothetical protein
MKEFKEKREKKELRDFLKSAPKGFTLSIPTKSGDITVGANSNDEVLDSFLKTEREMTSSQRVAYNNNSLAEQIEGTCKKSGVPSGISAEVEISGKSVTFKYAPQSVHSDDPAPKLVRIDYDPLVLQIDEKLLSKAYGKRIKSSSSLEFKAIKNESTSISIITDRGAFTVTLTAMATPSSCNAIDFQFPVSVKYETREIGGVGEFSWHNARNTLTPNTRVAIFENGVVA